MKWQGFARSPVGYVELRRTAWLTPAITGPKRRGVRPRGLFTARTRCRRVSPPPPSPPPPRRLPSRTPPRPRPAAAPHRWRVWELASSVRSHDRAPAALLYKPPPDRFAAFRVRHSYAIHVTARSQHSYQLSNMSYDIAMSHVDDGPQPVSRTYQYRKVMKPMLERKRRARINRCLDELKELMVSALQSEGENVAKLEKADILELTVRHLNKLRHQKRLSLNPTVDADRFRAGFTHAANEVSRCLASIPGVDVRLGTQLMTHLGHRLNDMQRATADTPPASPPSPALSSASSSSGYVTPSPPSSPMPVHMTPLDYTTTGSAFTKSPSVWRPW